MNKTRLEYFKKQLLEHRARILNRSAARGNEAFQLNQEDLVDESDHAASVVQQGLSLEVIDRDRRLLAEIDHALDKIPGGTYGICEDTEEPIDESRLEAQPWTRYSVEAAELREQKAKSYASR